MGGYDRKCEEEGKGDEKQRTEKVEGDRKWTFRRCGRLTSK